MEDMERYGDYNNIEDDEPKKKSTVFTLLKILTAVICIFVVGVLAFRMIVFNNYPDSVKRIYFNEALTEYYTEGGGVIEAKTQRLRYPYDDPDLGNFFANYLVVIEEIDQLQITVRYNEAVLASLAESLELSGPIADEAGNFQYRLVDNYGRIYESCELAKHESSFMYRYDRLIFDGVDFSGEGGENAPEWIRIEIFVSGMSEACAMIPIYENSADYSAFTEYKLSDKEKPQ